VAARDGVCAFPTCNQPGWRCDFEHIVEFRRGGRTCRCNGALACRRHNNCKIDTGWSYQRNPDGSFTWTTDTGRRYTGHPPGAWRRSEDSAERCGEPAAASQLTVDEWWARQDADYSALLARWRAALAGARVAADRCAIGNAKRALADARRQRKRELAHRRDPTKPPF
jgi:hypothetical protein